MSKNFNLMQVHTVLEHEEIKPYHQILSRPIVADVIRQTLSQIRSLVNYDNHESKFDIILECKKSLQIKSRLRLQRVINATGTILHTNLGRSPIDKDVWSRASELNTHACNLEYDITSKKRGRRGLFLHELLAKLASAESALVVNNNAAAIFLILKALASDGEVIVSRGEQVQIGGGFRIPDILKEAGCNLVEVGTTNITTLKDYTDRITPKTMMILKVHPSNFQICGFTESPSIANLRAAISSDIPIVYDEGAGILNGDLHIKHSIKSGADLVCSSGDKMFGGVQAGIIFGSHKLVSKISKHPLMRAFRAGKSVLSLLELYAIDKLNDVDINTSYCNNILKMNLDIVRSRAVYLASRLDENMVSVIDADIEIGGGAMPAKFFKSFALQIKHRDVTWLSNELHNLDIPIITKIQRNAILLYTATVDSEDLEYVETALNKILN